MFENLSKETLEKVKQAKTKEEALELLKQNGITLSDEDLANVSGGDGQNCWQFFPCESNDITPCPPDCMLYTPFCDIVCYPLTDCPEYCVGDGGPIVVLG